jgi:hypothetical protein
MTLRDLMLRDAGVLELASAIAAKKILDPKGAR